MLKKTGPGGRPMHSSLRFALRFAVLLPGLLVAAPARAQTICSPVGAQVSHDSDLAADCAAGLCVERVCVERVCVDTLYRRAAVCGHGFAGAPAVLVGGQTVPVLSNTPGPCGAGDEAMVIGLDDAIEGQHKLVVYNVSKKSEPFFIKVGELAGPQGPIGPQGPPDRGDPLDRKGPPARRGASDRRGARARRDRRAPPDRRDRRETPDRRAPQASWARRETPARRESAARASPPTRARTSPAAPACPGTASSSSTATG